MQWLHCHHQPPCVHAVSGTDRQRHLQEDHATPHHYADAVAATSMLNAITMLCMHAAHRPPAHPTASEHATQSRREGCEHSTGSTSIRMVRKYAPRSSDPHATCHPLRGQHWRASAGSSCFRHGMKAALSVRSCSGNDFRLLCILMLKRTRSMLMTSSGTLDKDEFSKLVQTLRKTEASASAMLPSAVQRACVHACVYVCTRV